MRFIHAADAHIDSPLRGLEIYPGAPLERIRQATREAFANLVTLAVEQEVAFVIIAGDLFDGPWPDMQTGIWTAAQFRRLDAEGIPVYLLRGNHDAVSEVGRAMRWPSNVREFSCDSPETLVEESVGVALHGQGFSRRDATEDLAAGYPPPLAGHLNIGVLHTSLSGDPRHDTYAPTSLSVLRNQGYQYWALGHIHQRSHPPLSTDPHILFSGNLQGRHIREPGAKGCLVVTAEGNHIDRVEFVATDTVRWCGLRIDLEPDHGSHELFERVRHGLESCRADAEGRFVAVRLTLAGPCRAHAELQRPGQREAAAGQIRDTANAIDGCWIEKIEWDTHPVWNWQELRDGNDMLAELLRGIDQVRTDPVRWSRLSRAFDEIESRHARDLYEAGIDLSHAADRDQWLRQAEILLATRLVEHMECD